MGSEITIESVLKNIEGDLCFVEIGVLRGATLVHIADHCLNVKKIIGIDFYESYIDELESNSIYSVDVNLAKMNLHIARKKIADCSRPEIIELILMDCIKAASIYENNIDCIFLDAYMNESDVISHINAWIPKLKNNGILLGHDIHTQTVLNGLNKCNLKYDILPNNIWIHRKK